MAAKTKIIHVALEPDMKRELTRHAKRLGFSLSLLARLALMDYLMRQRKETDLEAALQSKEGVSA